MSRPETITEKSSIEDMKGKIITPNHFGTLSPNRFEIVITGIDNKTLSERMNIMCETVSFPGRSVSTQPARVYGPIREMPYESLYTGDLDITFRVGRDMAERNFFEEWLNRVVSRNSHDFKYYGTEESGYAKEIKIHQLDKGNNVVYAVRVREAYPKAVNAYEVGHEKTDEYSRQVVSFSFRDYIVEYANWTDTTSAVESPPTGFYSDLQIPVTQGKPYYQRIGAKTARTGNGNVLVIGPPKVGSGEISDTPHNSYTRIW
mgnify:CR=1 FL=1